MVDFANVLSLVSAAAGALGGALLFIEFFQVPSYLTFKTEWESWHINMSPTEVDEFTWAGRIGALLIAFAFALQFIVALL